PSEPALRQALDKERAACLAAFQDPSARAALAAFRPAPAGSAPGPLIMVRPHASEPVRTADRRPGFRTLADYVASHAHSRPGHLALRVDGQALPYGQLHDQVIRVAAGLEAAGVRQGEHVALLLPNCCEFVISWLALSRLGAVTAPLNTAFACDNL